MYVELPGTPNKFVKVDKCDLVEAATEHGDLWVLGKLSTKAIVVERVAETEYT